MIRRSPSTRRDSRLGRPAAAGSAFAALLTVAACIASCTPPGLLTLRSSFDSLRVSVDTMAVRDSMALAALRDTRRELAEQRDILLSTRASSGTTTQELFEQMGRLEGKLDEVMGRFDRLQRTSPPPATGGSTATPGASAPSGGEANQIYDQAAQDLTQGRYEMAQKGFRDFVRRFPEAELADNAQYGVAESFFARSQFDSAAAEYARVETVYPQGDKVPAALYKLALSQEKLGRPTDMQATLERLVRRFPLSGEAQLAKERLGGPRKR